MGLVFFLGSGGRSQRSTLKSGPLARVKRPGNGQYLGEWQKLRPELEA